MLPLSGSLSSALTPHPQSGCSWRPPSRQCCVWGGFGDPHSQRGSLLTPAWFRWCPPPTQPPQNHRQELRDRRGEGRVSKGCWDADTHAPALQLEGSQSPPLAQPWESPCHPSLSHNALGHNLPCPGTNGPTLSQCCGLSSSLLGQAVVPWGHHGHCPKPQSHNVLGCQPQSRHVSPIPQCFGPLLPHLAQQTLPHIPTMPWATPAPPPQIGIAKLASPIRSHNALGCPYYPTAGTFSSHNAPGCSHCLMVCTFPSHSALGHPCTPPKLAALPSHSAPGCPHYHTAGTFAFHNALGHPQPGILPPPYNALGQPPIQCPRLTPLPHGGHFSIPEFPGSHQAGTPSIPQCPGAALSPPGGHFSIQQYPIRPASPRCGGAQHPFLKSSRHAAPVPSMRAGGRRQRGPLTGTSFQYHRVGH